MREQDDFTLSVILTLSFLVCSIGSCGAVSIHFLVKKAGLSDTASRLLFCLAFSDLIGAVVWFADIMFPYTLCPYSGALNMFGYQSAQFWTCIIGAYLIITCSAKQPPPEILFYAIAWGLPLIIQIILVTQNLYSEHPAPHGCWVAYGSTTILVFVTIPQLAAVVLNWVFLGTIIYKMRISAKRWGLQSRDRGLFFVMICFLLTTVSAILESVPNGDVVYIVAVCFGALQGFFNSIAMKQKAILQFMGKVKTKIRPIAKTTSSSSPTPYTSLLDSSTAKHPAITDNYSDYYHSNLKRSQASMTFLTTINQTSRNTLSPSSVSIQ
jgi:hypothetical protein